ncbi:hypothetical protein, partial [Roseivirga misakiensis]|uniref:hypothetical protein n=1 Tax=Roseivirga misakiensis TaxID=1563681 RepID=UPI00114D0D8A
MKSTSYILCFLLFTVKAFSSFAHYHNVDFGPRLLEGDSTGTSFEMTDFRTEHIVEQPFENKIPFKITPYSHIEGSSASATVVDFNSSGFVEGANLGAIYTEGNFRFTTSSTWIADADSGTGGSAALYITSGSDPITVTVETVDGTELDFQSFTHIVFFGTITGIEGFKDGSSEGTQTTGLSGTVTLSNTIFDSVDKMVITLNASGFPIEGFDDFTFGTAVASDTDPPTFDVAPSASSVTTTGFTAGASIDEGGDIYYVVVADGASAP